MAVIPLATLAQVRLESKVGSADDTADDVACVQAMHHVSGRTESITGRWFTPQYKARVFDARGDHITARTLDVDEDLLALTALTNGDDAAVTLSGVVTEPANTTPKYRIRLKSSSGVVFTYTDDWEQAITVTGYYGYHSDYANAWFSSGDTVQNNPLTDSATTVTVVDADGVDAYTNTPRFSVGQLIRIESEFIEVLGVNTSTNVLTVRRGVNGTTAAQHVQGTAISIWAVEDSINRAVIKWAGLLVKRRGQYEQVSFDGMTTYKFPKDAPDETQAVLDQYLKRELSII